MKTIRVDVTTADIRLGVPGSEDECAVQIAVERATNERTVSVAAGLICVGRHAIPMPRKVKKFVGDFDEHKPVAPFSFTLKMPT